MIDDPHIEKIIEIAGSKIPVWLYGNPKNPPIAFIHGYRRGFSDYIGDLPPRYLLRDYFVVAFDLPGFGKSKGIDMDRIEFVRELIQKTIPNRKFIIFGSSYGGAIAIKFTIAYPHNIKALIIAGTPYKGFYKILAVARHVPKLGKKLKFLEDILFVGPESLFKIKVPVLLYYSKKRDYLAPLSMGLKIKSLLPRGELYTVENRTHRYHLHRIDETGFLNAINKFVSKWYNLK